MADSVNIVVHVTNQTGPGIASVNRDFDKLKTAALSLAPALIPIAAATVPIAAQMGAAGVAVGAFTAALIPQAKAMGAASDAQGKYEEAVAKYGATSTQAAEAENAYLQQVQKLPPATRQAAAAVSVLKDNYKRWSDSLASNTMAPVTHSVQLLSALFPKLSPLVKGASAELDRFVTIAAGGVASPGFDKLMRQFSDFATGALRDVNNGLVHLLRRLNEGAGAGPLAEFMDYAKRVGPQVAETLTNLAKALVHVVASAADTGVSLLGIVNALAKLVNALPTEVVGTLLQFALAFKAVKLAAAGAAAVQGAVAAFSGAITAMTTAAAGATGRMASLTAAFGALSRGAKVGLVATGIGVLVIALAKLSGIGKSAPPNVDRMTTSLGKLAQTGKMSGEAARVLGSDMSKLAEAVRGMERPSNLEKVQQGLTSLIGMDSTPVKQWKSTLDGLDKSLANLVKSGNADLAEKVFQRAAKSMRDQGLSTKELRKNLGDYKSALADQAFAQKIAAEGMGLFGEQAQATQRKLDAQKQSADGLRQSIQALNEVNRQGLGGMIGFEAAIDAAAKAAKENAGSLRMINGELDLNSPKAQAAATALNDLASKTDAATSAAREQGKSWTQVSAVYERGRQKLIENAMQMGLNRAEAKRLASQILKTPDKTAMIKADLKDLEGKLRSAKSQLKKVPDSRKAAIKAQISDLQKKIAQAKSQLWSLPNRTVSVYVRTVGLAAARAALSALGGYAGFAHGGVVGGHAAEGGPRTGMTLVGEHGPELVNLAPGSRVRSNPDTRRMLGGTAPAWWGSAAAAARQNFAAAGAPRPAAAAAGAAGESEPMVLEIRSGGSRMDDLLVELLRGAIRVKGGNVQRVLGVKGA
ncbi:hypothetical protein [Streptomyces sp. Inha503]|uniref:hypothetical protein n=1 Tax=Streptomyces sp. Inha503 TaxID=3383314 RepID=UPI0039A17B49